MSKHSVAHYQRLNGRRAFASHGHHRGHHHGRRWTRIFLILFLVLLVGAGLSGGYLYMAPAGRPSTDTTYIFVSPGSGYQELHAQLQKKLWLRFPRIFDYLATWKGLNAPQHPLRSGRYAVPRDYTMLEVIDLLQHGEQTPLTLTPLALRTNKELVDFFAQHLWVKADSIQALLQDSDLMRSYGATNVNFYAQAIRQPMTLAWDASAKTVLDSIHSGYLRFWQGKRTEEASRLGLSPLEVTTLASIVESESSKPEEYRRIAGLYLNRLKKDIRLQSDPTVKYAVGDFSLKRIRGEHLRVVSPYNTYLVKGLPPSPIVLPRTGTIDSVLVAEHHDFLYMCAKEDFSGYHNFASTFAEHLANANRYQQTLNQRGIR